MSRSNANTTENPSKRWFKWSGSHGTLEYWDKDKQENVTVKTPFTFLVLDQLSTITGWSDDAQSGIWSNEVRDLRNEALTVRTKQGIMGKGPYDQVKNLKGARFTKSIYIAYYDDDKNLQIGNLKATGACLSAWIEFTKGRNVLKGAVTLADKHQAKKGATKYFIPVFEGKDEISEETNDKAIALDKILQDYLKGYLTKTIVENEFEHIEIGEIDDGPFESKMHEDDVIPF